MAPATTRWSSLMEDFDESLGDNSLYLNVMTNESCLSPSPNGLTLSIDFYVTVVGDIKCVQLIDVVRTEVLHASL